MKVKKDFIISKVGDDFVVVPVGKSAAEFSGIIEMNRTGEFLWRAMENDTTEDELIAKMLANYEDLDEPTARAELQKFLSTISMAIE